MFIIYYCSVTHVISYNDAEYELIRQILDNEQKVIYEAEMHDDSKPLVEFQNEPSFSHNNQDKMLTEEEPNIPNGFDCIIKIPSINLEKIVYTGDGRGLELENYNLVTAANDMKYEYGGNYIICGHNSKLYGHSLSRIHEVEIGDAIFIYHNKNRYEYTVHSIEYHNMHQISSYLQQSEEKELTILSCSKNRDKEEYIIIKCKYKN